MPFLHELQSVDDLAQAQIHLGKLMDLPRPAPEDVTRRALADERFAFYLLMTKDSPALQQALFEDARTKAFAGGPPGIDSGLPDAPAKTHATTDLLGRASKSFLDWGLSGFHLADPDLQNRRWAICLNCDHLTDPPDSILYQGLKLLAGKDTKICSACGCAANKKVMLPTEHCPVQSPHDPNQSLWGEPWVKPKGQQGQQKQ